MRGTSVQGKVLLSVKDALARAFPKAKVERQTVYLTKAHKQQLAKLLGKVFSRKVVFPYVAKRKGSIVGVAWFDAHRVRSKREVLMIATDSEQRIRRIEVLRFDEPVDYLPRQSFYEQFEKRTLSSKLRVGRGIRGVSGATLTARATAAAARRSLALQQVLAKQLGLKRKAKTEAKREEKAKPGDRAKRSDKVKGSDKAKRGAKRGAEAKRGANPRSHDKTKRCDELSWAYRSSAPVSRVGSTT